LAPLEVLPFEIPADKVYGVIRTRLEKAGSTDFDGNDLLIASHTVALGHTVVTDNNEDKFSRVENLRHENWLS